jgi:hypothetical protein
MTDTLNQTQLAQIVSAVLAAFNTSNSSAPKAPAISSPVDKLAQRHAAIRAGFKRRGFQNVVLMDRNDPTKPFNVRPFKGWLEQGRQVRKGQRGVKGLFFIDQTDVIKPAKAAIPAEQKTLFAEAKKVLAKKKAKASASA